MALQGLVRRPDLDAAGVVHDADHAVGADDVVGALVRPVVVGPDVTANVAGEPDQASAGEVVVGVGLVQFGFADDREGTLRHVHGERRDQVAAVVGEAAPGSGIHRDHIANGAFVDQGLHLQVVIPPAAGAVDGQRNVGPLAGVDDGIRLGEGERDGFFRPYGADAVAAVGDFQQDVGTRLGGGAHADDVGPGFLEHLAIVGEERVEAPLGAGGLTLFDPGVGHADDFDLGHRHVAGDMSVRKLNAVEFAEFFVNRAGDASEPDHRRFEPGHQDAAPVRASASRRRRMARGSSDTRTSRETMPWASVLKRKVDAATALSMRFADGDSDFESFASVFSGTAGILAGLDAVHEVVQHVDAGRSRLVAGPERSGRRAPIRAGRAGPPRSATVRGCGCRP